MVTKRQVTDEAAIPKVETPLRSVAVKEGENAKFTCHIRSEVELTATW